MAQAHWFPRLIGLFALAWFSSTSIASAQDNTGWSVCNRTSFVIEAAAAYPEGAGIVVNGWTRLAPGACELVLPAPLRTGVHYLYARSSGAHRGGLREWRGDQSLCVDTSGGFSLESKANCPEWGLEARMFRPVAIERRGSWRTELTETNEYSLERAQTAGIQRLLRDVGASNRRIDGIIGNRTRRAIAQFLRDIGVEEVPADEDLIDILEQQAIERGRDVGMTLCNRTNDRIWGAIARRKGDGWESRGWWRLDAGGCAKVIDEVLIDADHFVFAELEATDQPVRTLNQGSDTFCVARARFAINGRENCSAFGYRPALFASSRPADGKLVYEFFERDFSEPIGE